MRKKSVGLKEIAYELNISVNTVSRALRDMDDISSELKIKVRQKAIEMGYVPNQLSQFIKKDGRKLVALLINSFENLYFSMLSSGIIKNFETTKQYDFTILFSAKQRLTGDVIKQCISQRVDLILSHLEPTVDALDIAKLNNIYIVLVGTFESKLNVDIVTVDERMGSELVARNFYGFYNIGKVIFVGRNNYISRLRYSLFANEFRKVCLNNELEYIDYDGDYNHIYNYIINGYRGLYFFNDELAYEVINDLNRICYNIRKLYPDLHMVGFDCLREKINGLTQLTSIKTDFENLSNRAYELIDYRLKNPNGETKYCVIPVKLYQRKLDKE